MSKLKDKFPRVFALLTLLGLTAVKENTDSVELTNEALQTMENKIQTEITDVKTKLTETEAKLTKANDDLTIANGKVTAMEAAVKEACTAANVTGKTGVEAVTEVTATLRKWGALPGAMSTTPGTESDVKDKGPVLHGSAEYAQSQLYPDKK